jgi:hypothetical protein
MLDEAFILHILRDLADGKDQHLEAVEGPMKVGLGGGQLLLL